jgi:hypothetical protein
MQEASQSKQSAFAYAVGAALLAAGFGFGAGAFMAWLAPANKFSWVGLIVAPAWFLLELFFEATVEALGHRTKAARTASTIAVIAGFYVAWFLIRGVAA